jgi:fermentation-respiration switch protein FrsA (DUF1100 family)
MLQTLRTSTGRILDVGRTVRKGFGGTVKLARFGRRRINLVLRVAVHSPLFDPNGRPPAEPALAGLPEMRRISTMAEDGIAGVSWYAEAKPDQPTILFCHGRSGHVARDLKRARLFLDAGCGLLLLGYRGYGGNKGRPTERGLQADAEGALQWLLSQQLGYGDIVLYGRSLGSGVVMPVAAHRPFRAIILESPFASIPDVASVTHPRVPRVLMSRVKFDNLSKIKDIEAPLLILHGTEDEIVPPASAEKLYNAATAEKQILWFEGGSHSDLFARGAGASVIRYLAS